MKHPAGVRTGEKLSAGGARVSCEVERGEFLEWATVGSHRYGTTFAAIRAVSEAGRVGLLDVDVQGVEAVLAQPDLKPCARALAVAAVQPSASPQSCVAVLSGVWDRGRYLSLQMLTNIPLL